VGRFGSFAAGVSYISILTGTFQLFHFGLGSGGPAYWWPWPLVFTGQLMVALCFAELAARFPVAGSVRNWSNRLGRASTSWLAGWTMLVASIVTLAAVVLAYQLTLPQIWSGLPGLRRAGDHGVRAGRAHTATIRIMFAMARDNNLPGGAALARVHPVRRTPVVPAVVIGVLAVLILVVNIRQP
jgi:amino acid transporter